MREPGARLYVLIARKARRAVVFRRGPSKSVLVLGWNLKDDTLTVGQWFKGRIYERRCDLSPDGELLSYFAANWRSPFASWTGVSRPPYITALALWPKGDAWGGGGLFQNAHTLLLNHRPGEDMQLAEGFTTPAGFKVAPLGDYSGGGEDDPIGAMRRERDGWVVTSPGEQSEYNRSGPMSWRIDPPMVSEKPLGKREMVLRTNLHDVAERDGTWYVQTGQVAGPTGVVEDLGRIDWADVDHNSDVLFARGGRLFRRAQRQLRLGSLEPPKLVADLNDLRLERRASPSSARSWPKSARAGRVD